MKIIFMLIIGFSLSYSALDVDTVMDEKTGLLWQDNVDTISKQMSWKDSINYCKNLEFKGFSDWFLPEYKQLQSVIDKKKYNPATKLSFKNIFHDNYWSSSHSVIDPSTAIGINMKSGEMTATNTNYNSYTRCVRKSSNIKLEQLIEEELQNIPKPQQELKLVRDEFETTQEFQIRVEDTKKNQKKIIREYQKNYAQLQKDAKKRAIKKILEMTWGKPLLSNLRYDADNGYFVADIQFEMKKDFQKKVAIRVERKNARTFKKEFLSLKPEAVFDYDGQNVKLKDIRIPYKEQKYLALFTDLNIDETRMAVNLTNNIQVDRFISSSVSVGPNSVKSFDTSKLTNFSELEKLLAKTKAVKQDNKKWLFVVGIEKYAYTDNISYARRSATMFEKIMQKKLGVTTAHTYTLLDEEASQARIKTNLKKMLRRVHKGDTIYFYYNGHGIPIPSLNYEPFILASDSEPDYIADEQFFSLKNIYAQLSNSKAAKIVAFVDSCFSGVTDGRAVLKGVAATKMVAKTVSFDKDKMLVMTAGKGNQYSNGYNKKGYRLFSFYLMKNILEGNKEIKQLYKKTKSETYDTSYEEYGDSRLQEPQIEGNFRLKL